MSGGHTVHIQRSANEAVEMSLSLYVASVSLQSGFNGVAVPLLRSAHVLPSNTQQLSVIKLFCHPCLNIYESRQLEYEGLM